MKYSFEARAEARQNRQKIIDANVSRAIKELEICVDRAIERGYFVFTANLNEFLEDYDTEIKEAIENNIEKRKLNDKEKLAINKYREKWMS